MDWTANALYALYFACLGDPMKAAAVWCIRGIDGRHSLDALRLSSLPHEHDAFTYLDAPDDAYQEDDWRRVEDWDPAFRRLKLVEPPYNSDRLLAQDGVFTVHNCPQCPLEEFVGKDLADRDLDLDLLLKWSIPAGRKEGLIRQLSGLGITHRSVYPDLDGIARSLWETEVLFRGLPPRHPHP
jgi:hypothetical protein